MDKIIVSTKLSLEDYIKVNYYLLYSKFVIKLFTAIGFIIMVSLIVTYDANESFPWVQLLFGLLMIVGIPIQVYLTSQQNYKKHKVVSEQVTYEFSEEEIVLKGETFSSKLSWENIYRVTESKNWILVWQSKRGANILRKVDFKDNALKLFKELVKSRQGLRYKLR